MTTAGLRELRQNASDLVRRVEAGERIEITVQGRVVAELVPAATRRRWQRWDDVQDIWQLPPDLDWESDLQRAAEHLDEGLVDPFDRRAR